MNYIIISLFGDSIYYFSSSEIYTNSRSYFTYNFNLLFLRFYIHKYSAKNSLLSYCKKYDLIFEDINKQVRIIPIPEQYNPRKNRLDYYPDTVVYYINKFLIKEKLRKILDN